MELSNDQKAILRLLAQRGASGYEDLTALLGIDAAEVHERAKAAAAQLEADGIPAPSIPAPGADQPAAVPGPTKPAPPSEPAPESTAPAPPPPPPPVQHEAPAAAAPAAPAPPAPAATTRSSQPVKLALPKTGSARAALATGVAIVVALIVVVILVSSGGDSDSGSTTSAGESTTAAEEGGKIAAANPKLTQAVLSPVDGGEAKGLATFGRVKNSLALQLEAEGLEPTGKGESYTVWLYESASKRLPLASTTVGANGKIGAQVEVPTEVLAYLATEAFDQLYLSRTDDATLKAALTKAEKEKKSPTYTGTDVLSGTISGPIIGAAKKAKKK
jgi:hypothetical protein